MEKAFIINLPVMILFTSVNTLRIQNKNDHFWNCQSRKNVFKIKITTVEFSYSFEAEIGEGFKFDFSKIFSVNRNEKKWGLFKFVDSWEQFTVSSFQSRMDIHIFWYSEKIQFLPISHLLHRIEKNFFFLCQYWKLLNIK